MDKSMLSAVKDQLAVKQADASRIAASFGVDDQGRFSMSTEQHTDYKRAVGEAKELKGILDAANEQAAIQEYMDAPEGKSIAGSDFGRGISGDQGPADLASAFIESKAYQSAQANGFEGEPRIHATIEGKSIFNFSGGTNAIQALGRAENVGISEQMKRKMHIRDLFPKSTTKASVLYGVRETGWVNNAKQVNQRYAADGVSPAANLNNDIWGRVPKSKITLTPQLFPVAAIRATLDSHKHILDDEPRLRTFLNTRMLDGVKYAEDYDLLNATGSGEQITGLFNTPGVQTYTGVNSDKYSVQVRRSITKALLAEYEPNGLIISPNLWEQIEVEEDDQGAFRVAVAVAVGAEKRVWRVNVVETTAISDSKFVVGAFGLGAQLHDRQAVSVSVSTENASNVEDGIVTFVGEQRVAFEVVRPESFVIGTWTTPV